MVAGAQGVAVGSVPAVRGDGPRLGVQRQEMEPVPPLWRQPREETVMGWKPKVKVTLVKCGTCGRSYNNPLTHTCVIRFNPRAAKKIAKPKGKR